MCSQLRDNRSKTLCCALAARFGDFLGVVAVYLVTCKSALGVRFHGQPNDTIVLLARVSVIFWAIWQRTRLH